MELAVGAAEILLHNGADFTCALASYFLGGNQMNNKI